MAMSLARADTQLFASLTAKGGEFINRNAFRDAFGTTWDGEASLTVTADDDTDLKLLNLNFVNNETFFNFSCYEASEQTLDAESFFQTNISWLIIQDKCIACHVTNGVAGATPLLYAPSTVLDHQTLNFELIHAYIEEDGTRADTMLNKVRGVAHGGGVVLSSNDAEYLDLETFLNLLGTELNADAEAANIERTAAAEALFAEEVASPVVAARCLACHLEGGLSGHTGLVFDHDATAEQNSNNIDVFVNFLTDIEGGGDYILTKVRGGNSHGGGSIFSAASTEYNSLSDFLSLLQGDDPLDEGSIVTGFWEGIELADSSATLRRASLIFAGRLPTASEYSQAQGGDSDLRAAIRGLMTGEGFHDFLIEGANDQLLTDSLWEIGPFDAIDAGADLYPVMANKEYELNVPEPLEEYGRWRSDFTFGFGRAPLELIARVVENDLNYTEILTADYTMVNRGSAEIVRADTLTFPDQGSARIGTVFKVAKNQGQVVFDDAYARGEVTNGFIQVATHSGFQEYPHAGILTEHAFLGRYPTTETNRNRARARWTYLHFLGVDIEKAAGRTTDAEALADTDNPTLNNPNCAVCHQIHDPVAGAFQDFSNEGHYRISYGGLDSLPDSYKNPAEGESLYTEGDRWFADMRLPGFEGDFAPFSSSSITWLAEQIVADPRFASATVKFWWPALLGVDPTEAPEVVADQNFEPRLRAFEAQQADIEFLADAFRSGIDGGAAYNLKDLLVEMTMTSWFRAELTSSELEASRSEELQGIGVRRLLTPRELEEKTFELFGFRWGEVPDTARPKLIRTELGTTFNIYYGDIDAKGIVDRTRELTALMVNVAEAQAVQNACPAVVTDINLPNSQRILFRDVDRNMTPDTHEAELKQKLQELHALLLGEELAEDSIELVESYDLLVSIWQMRRDNNTPSPTENFPAENCWLPDEWYEQTPEQGEDLNWMLGTWVGMMVYFMTDFSYLHE